MEENVMTVMTFWLRCKSRCFHRSVVNPLFRESEQRKMVDHTPLDSTDTTRTRLLLGILCQPSYQTELSK